MAYSLTWLVDRSGCCVRRCLRCWVESTVNVDISKVWERADMIQLLLGHMSALSILAPSFHTLNNITALHATQAYKEMFNTLLALSRSSLVPDHVSRNGSENSHRKTWFEPCKQSRSPSPWQNSLQSHRIPGETRSDLLCMQEDNILNNGCADVLTVS